MSVERQECQMTSDGHHVWEELEDGTVLCFECNEVLVQGRQEKKKDRHVCKKIQA